MFESRQISSAYIIKNMFSNCCLFVICLSIYIIKANEDNSHPGTRIADLECQNTFADDPGVLSIIGGEKVQFGGEFPHMVALGFEGDSGYRFDCGGSLVSNRYVLTAAHCIDNPDRIHPSIVRMGVSVLGSAQLNPDTDVRVETIYKHPNYTRSRKYHDLALIKLERAVQFDSNVNAACLYTNDTEPTTLTIAGWGTTSATIDARSNILLKANVTLVPQADCSAHYDASKWRKLPDGISERQICAGHPEGLQDACQGDSGGPLQISQSDGQTYLVGVTSFGRGCGSPVPGVYTRLSRYLDWIESIVWMH